LQSPDFEANKILLTHVNLGGVFDQQNPMYIAKGHRRGSLLHRGLFLLERMTLKLADAVRGTRIRGFSGGPSKADPMRCNGRFWLANGQRRAPVAPETRETDPERTNAGSNLAFNPLRLDRFEILGGTMDVAKLRSTQAGRAGQFSANEAFRDQQVR